MNSKLKNALLAISLLLNLVLAVWVVVLYAQPEPLPQVVTETITEEVEVTRVVTKAATAPEEVEVTRVVENEVVVTATPIAEATPTEDAAGEEAITVEITTTSAITLTGKVIALEGHPENEGALIFASYGRDGSVCGNVNDATNLYVPVDGEVVAWTRSSGNMVHVTANAYGVGTATLVGPVTGWIDATRVVFEGEYQDLSAASDPYVMDVDHCDNGDSAGVSSDEEVAYLHVGEGIECTRGPVNGFSNNGDPWTVTYACTVPFGLGPIDWKIQGEGEQVEGETVTLNSVVISDPVTVEPNSETPGYRHYLITVAHIGDGARVGYFRAYANSVQQDVDVASVENNYYVPGPPKANG